MRLDVPAEAQSSSLEFVYQGRRYRPGSSFVHPGGQEVLEAFNGQDITSTFEGISAAHRHSLAATELLQSFPSSSIRTENRPYCVEGKTASTGHKAINKIEQAFAAGQPLLGLVGELGSDYNAWVHAPEVGQPRFFSSNMAEAVTKTPWWIVPIIWMPMIGCLLSLSAKFYGHTAGSMAAHTAAGVVLWQLIEYSIHRFIFHAIPSWPPAIVIHFLFHGCHHKYPMDRERLVFPPLPAASIASLLYLMVRCATSQESSVPIFAGVLIGYLVYDMQHYAIHYGRSNVWLLRAARQNHLDHHYRSPSHGFGISSGLVDFLLDTCQPSVLQRHANLAS